MKKSQIAGIVLGGLLAFSTSLTTITSAEAEELPITSNFGWRYHPIDGQYKFHCGVDLGYEYGASVPALFPGQVVTAGDYGDGYGMQVMLYHPDYDTYTKYCHLSNIYVVVGDYVQQGNIIASVGSSGYSTGPHLHLEYIIRGPESYEYADPLQIWSNY